ncbi:MAG TPA: hypothetical protein VE258_08385 [Ktedonobacterales bacterium]|nr:hypothetical protein [Ktedonobacterales bacterium]
MPTRLRSELLCGLGAFVLGLLLLLIAYLQPHSSSESTGFLQLELQPGFTREELPYIVGIGVPILGIVVGSMVDSLHRSRIARLVLWTSSILLGVEVLASALSLGPFLLPVLFCGLAASLTSVDPPSHHAQRVAR